MTVPSLPLRRDGKTRGNPVSQKFDLLRAVQSRAARAAVGPAAVRGRGMTGVVEAARTFLRAVPLAAFGIDDRNQFLRDLDGTTARLQNALPTDARNTGGSRARS